MSRVEITKKGYHEYYKNIMGWIDELQIFERIVPGYVQLYCFLRHLARYNFAINFVKGKTVLDVGCGAGYGTYHLAKCGAKKVIGIDISDEAIRFAKRNYILENLEFRVMDIMDTAVIFDKYFDVIIAFEVIEHVSDQERFLLTLKNLLKEKGLLILSTPNKQFSTKKNPYHIKEYDLEELLEVLRSYFTIKEIYGQKKPEYKNKDKKYKDSMRFNIRKYIPLKIRSAIRPIIESINLRVKLSDVLTYYKNSRVFEDNIKRVPKRFLPVKIDKKLAHLYEILIVICEAD